MQVLNNNVIATVMTVDTVHADILTVIGYVFVPISLVCNSMLLTVLILTYSCMRKLYSLSNYIHIMPCTNLFLSQVACSVIAVVLQYMFLVTFMWMLMEGVVLYIALAKVFSTQTQHYGVLFTILSYVDTGNDQPNHYLYYDNEELVA
uniref:G-protein coupled receptors family 2 profile 2 domain-containing protein n=1 Tax=Amphimedon queenslandica TaxID=400682 RepID=A0A1X7SP96_AMPQE